MNNFEFLKKEWPVLANIGEIAEKTLYIDSNLTFIKLRQLAEIIATYIMQFEEIYESENITFSGRLRELKKEDWIPKNIIDIFYAVKNLGNRAAHDNYSSVDEAKIILKLAFRLSVWYHEVYGQDYSFDGSKVTYQIPQFIDKTYEYRAEIEYLNKENKKLIDEYHKVTEELKNNRSKEERKIISIKAYKKLKLDEKETRKIIDEQLKAAGWIVDSENLKYSKGTRPQKGKNLIISEWPTKSGKRIDYAMFIGLKFAGIIEAKRESKDVMAVLESDTKFYSRDAKIVAKETFIDNAPFNEYFVPFMFATNSREYTGQLKIKSGIWFLDGRLAVNHPKALRNWPSPKDFEIWLKQDKSLSNEKLKKEPFDYLKSKNGLMLRDYQIKAIKSVEKAVIDGNEKILLTMATGTGKTRTAIALLYRLLKTKRFNRILFIVDRKSLGNQAVSSFKDAKMEDFQSFSSIYEIKELKDRDIEDTTKIHVATIQGLVKRVLYSDEKPSVGAYDAIVVDEAHRGYFLDKSMNDFELEYKNQNDYISKYRNAIEYFNAVKIGLTATPAIHTVDIFGAPVFTYSYREAVIDGYLVDHEPVYILETKLNTSGIHYKSGDEIEVYNTYDKKIEKEKLLDELDIDVSQFNKKVITPNFNKTVLSEIFLNSIDIDEDGKTLIFASNDEHADLVVKTIKEILIENEWDFDDNAIVKITGYIKNQEEMIRRFKNEEFPKVVVTVDLLTTGIDVPEITNLIFLRKVKSRILYEQMLGRATRLAPDIKKDYFRVFDTVGIYEDMMNFTDMKSVVRPQKVKIETLLSDFKSMLNTDEEKIDFYNDNITKENILNVQKDEIIASLQRFAKRKLKLKNSGVNHEEFEDMITELKGLNHEDFIKKAEENLDDLLIVENIYYQSYKKPENKIISRHEDEIIDVKRGYDEKNIDPEDYLNNFKRYIAQNREKIEAIRVLCDMPDKITRKELKEIVSLLDKNGFHKKDLQIAYKNLKKEDITVDIITLIREAVGKMEIIGHEERINRAVAKVKNMAKWNIKQQKIIDLIKDQLIANNVITKENLDEGIFRDNGGYRKIDKILNGKVDEILMKINENLY